MKFVFIRATRPLPSSILFITGGPSTSSGVSYLGVPFDRLAARNPNHNTLLNNLDVAWNAQPYGATRGKFRTSTIGLDPAQTTPVEQQTLRFGSYMGLPAYVLSAETGENSSSIFGNLDVAAFGLPLSRAEGSFSTGTVAIDPWTDPDAFANPPLVAGAAWGVPSLKLSADSDLTAPQFNTLDYGYYGSPYGTGTGSSSGSGAPPVTVVDEFSAAISGTNLDAESGTSGWTSELGLLETRSANPAPYSGSTYFYGGSNSAETVARQRIDLLEATSLTSSQIASGGYLVELKWAQANYTDQNDNGGMGFRFLDENQTEILTSYAGMVTVTPGLVWAVRSHVTQVPAETRYVDLLIRAVRTDGTNNDTYIDGVEARCYRPGYINYPVWSTTSDGSSITSGLHSDAYAGYLSLAVPMNGEIGGSVFSDELPSGRVSQSKPLTVGGSLRTVTSVSKYYGSSGYFDGSTAYLGVTGDADFSFGQGDFTVEFWIRPEVQQADKTLVGFRAPGVASGLVIELGGRNGSTPGSLRVLGIAEGYVESVTAVGSALSWTHCAITRESGLLRVFVNGILEATAYDGNFYAHSQSRPIVGADDYAAVPASRFFQGWMQDLRIYKGIAKYKESFGISTN